MQVINNEPTKLERAVRLICCLIMLFVCSLICLIFIECLNAESLSAYYTWTRNNKEWIFPSIFTVFFWNLLWVRIRNKVSAGVRWGNGLLLFLAIVNHFKIDLRYEPLYPSDFFETGEAAGILGKMNLHFTPIVFLPLIVALLILPLYFPSKKIEKHFPSYLTHLLIAFLLLTGQLFLFVSIPETPANDDVLKYRTNGFLRSFLSNTSAESLEEPENYNEASIFAILSDGIPEASIVENSQSDSYPDIIFIMSESFYDLSSTGKIEFSRDPLERFKALQREGTRGQVMTLGYGGGTFFSEYEVLTGYQITDTPGKLYYHSEVMPENMLSLVTVLKDNGYSTMSIHPNYGGFYHRDEHYKALGFETMYFSDTGMPTWEDVNGLPSDRGLFEFLKEKYTDWEGSGPRFIHVVTFQNHATYGRKAEHGDIYVRGNENEEDDEKSHAANYANYLSESVNVLESLLLWCQNQQRDILVVFWGDHAPNLREFGINMPSSTFDRIPYYLTPLLIWNNYGKDISLPNDEIIAPYRLGAVILNQLGLTSDPYFNYLACSDQPDIMSALNLIEKDENFTYDPDTIAQIDDALRALHYDRIFGNQYSIKWRPE